MPGHVLGRYTQSDSARYGADADWGVLYRVHNAHWRNLANTNEPSACAAAMRLYVKIL